MPTSNERKMLSSNEALKELIKLTYCMNISYQYSYFVFCLVLNLTSVSEPSRPEMQN